MIELSVWLTTVEVATVTRRHPVTVRRALESGELHGHQRHRGCRWQIKAEAVEAWRFGTDGAKACGCATFRSRR